MSGNRFCTQYCGWHSYGYYGNSLIKFAFIGNPISFCPHACTAEVTSPNGYRGVDGMASVIAHELAESASDPLVSCRVFPRLPSRLPVPRARSRSRWSNCLDSRNFALRGGVAGCGGVRPASCIG